jgi:hypothetical protein
VADVERIEAILDELLARLDGLDPSTRAMLPNRRTIEARCPDLDLVRHAEWRQGRLSVLDAAPPRRPDIRISVRSDDLVRIADGEVSFGQAYLAGRVRVDASMSDLLRLRTLL